jgi:hypothetical protein
MSMPCWCDAFRMPIPRGVLFAFTLSVLGACAPGSDPRTDEGSTAALSAAADLVTRIPLTLPADPPEHLHLPIELDGQIEILILSRHSLRSSAPRLLVHRADGSLAEEPLPPVRTYRGHLGGRPQVTALASLSEEGLHARLIEEGEVRWTLRPASDSGGILHEIIAGVPEADFRPPCGFSHCSLVAGSASSHDVPIDHLPLGPCRYLAEIAFDADFEFYQAQGSSVPATVARIEEHMNIVDFLYGRDVLITYEITTTVVRTAPFYFPLDGADLLNLFWFEWSANMGHLDYDIFHLMTGKPLTLLGYGGLATLGYVCKSSIYPCGWSIDDHGILAHELAHNWSADHCLDPGSCNLLCGEILCLYIGPNSKDAIMSYRDTRDCLDLVPASPVPFPPYAHADTVDIRRDELALADEIHLDVLTNDHDGNCQNLRLVGSYGSTPKGASLHVSKHTGPGRRDELVYTPPDEPFVGVDVFGYVVADGTGLETSAEVVLNSNLCDLAGWWKLDEGGGDTVGDSTLHARDGTVSGFPNWSPGIHSGGLEFDGIDDKVSIPALDLHTDTLTITAWAQRLGDQSDSAGLVFSRDGSTVAGLGFREGNELGYWWNDDPRASDWNSGLVPPDGRWAFIALVVEPHEARVYLQEGAANLQFAGNPVTHEVEEFDGELTLGCDGVSGSGYARVILDDVRVYDFALTTAELSDLVLRGGAAQVPEPPDGASVYADGLQLEWTAGATADSHLVYLGTSFDAVQQATPFSPEFRGVCLSPFFDPGALPHGTKHFWRIDEGVAASTARGRVWQFTTSAAYHWTLDETSGPTAFEERWGHDGSYVGGATLGEPGATALTGTSVRFDGADGHILVPAPLHLRSNTITITAWVKRNGGQSPYTGIVYSRDGNTSCGLNFNAVNGLSYIWANDPASWGWNPGLLVPDQTWVFVALVVEADRVSMYRGDGGTLSSASTATSHDLEEFDGELDIARDRGHPARNFDGWLDDVRIYDAALSAEHVEALYRSY